MRLKSFLERFSIVICSLIFFFFILELFFRIFYPHSGYSLTYAPWGWTHMPNTKVIFYKEISELNFDIRKRPYPIPIKYNSKGLREYEYDYKKKDNVFRILVLGDSWAEDMGSFFENLHTKWLERKLNGMGYPYKFEVINAGHYSFNSAQEYMYYINEGRKYSPNIVIVMFTDNVVAEYTTLVDGKLTLNYKSFSSSQKLYRNIVSFIRRNTHFGSFLLDKINSLRELKIFLISKGYKEEDKPIVGPSFIGQDMPEQTLPIEEGNKFTEVDKALWISFNNNVKNDGGALIFFYCFDRLNKERREFLIANKILLLERNKSNINDYEIKDKEIKLGTYNKFYDSYRFGYKINELVADDIIDFLLDNHLLPKKL